MENILVIRLKAIGDVVFTLPAISMLRENFPAAKITFLTSKENASLLRGFREVNEVIALDRAALRSGHPLKIGAEVFGLIRRLRTGKFSLVVDFQASAKPPGSRGSPARRNAGAASMAPAAAGLTRADWCVRKKCIRRIGICGYLPIAVSNRPR